MAEKQTWVTFASNDGEGLKALVLARSLRRSITRRQLLVFISSQVSEGVLKLLEDEFDRCVKIRKEECNQEFPDQPFSIVAKVHCWRLKRFMKFVFLDCNSMVLKNADELFKEMGIGLVQVSNGGNFVSVIAGRAGPIAWNYNTVNSKIFKAMRQLNKEGKVPEPIEYELNEKYCTQVDLFNDGFPLSGKEIKILHFAEMHPLDLIFLHKENLIGDMSEMHKKLVKLCLDLVPLDTITDQIENNGTTFAAKVNNAKNILTSTNTDKEIPTNPDSNILDDLKDSVAIVGISFRLPGANTIDEFWDLLVNGKDAIIRVPEGRWNKDQCFIRGDNTKDTQAGFLKCPIDMIDGKFFGLNAADLAYMDPQQRLCLQVVWEGIENAGISGSQLKESQTGVFGGWWRNDYKEMLQEAGLNETEFFRAYMGNALGTLTGRISHYLELTGPSISTESGCSTSIVAVDMACNSLKEENCDLALVVGVNLLIHPFSIDAMNAVVAMDGRSKTFDSRADGFGRAEGCAVLVLKRFADAAADGDRIWGVIRGSAVVQEGPSRSLGTPTVKCEALAMSLALERAGVQPKDVSFVETHGTGTPVGDPLEVAAVGEVYSKDRDNTLIIGSVKTNIGHSESVSGIAGIVKTVLSLQNEIIPKHLHLETLNPEINLGVIPAQIPLEAMKWERVESKPRIAGVSSFGITGTDAHVIVQETPETHKTKLILNDVRPLKMLTISAKSPEALEDYLETYKNYLQTAKDELVDIEFTSHVGRSHFSHRVGVIASNREEMIEKLEKKSYEMNQIPNEVPKVCFLLTGQGSQYPGMAKDLYENSLVFKINFDMCDNILTKEYGFSIKHALWDSDAHALSRTLYSQTSIFVVEYCLLKLWESWGVRAQSVLGHSLGEFAAAVAAGILEFKDALKLVVLRSKLIDSLPNGKMIVIKESIEVVEKLMRKAFEKTDKWLDIAAINAPDQTVLAGDGDTVLYFAQLSENNHIKTHVLDATHAFHSRHMDSVLEVYRTTCSNVVYKTPTIDYISGMEGKLLLEINADYWVRHTREKVNFLDASKVILELGCTHFIEIGPSPVLSAMILINTDVADVTTPISCYPSLRKTENNWDTMMTSLAKLYVHGIEINWDNYHRYSNAKKVDLPTYPFQLKSYWMEVQDSGAIPIHPLVGSPVPNPSALKIFKSAIDVYRTSFLKDHCVGNKIIFPGAGFLEMCLVSGHSAIQCTEGNYTPPTSALTIEQFQIEAPLCLNEAGQTQMQVVVSSEDNGETKVTIYSKLTLDKETHKWIRHASGNFSPFGSKWDGEEEFHNDSLENIKARCCEEITTEFDYSKLEEFGMKFGPTFQTIRNCWKGEKEVLFRVGVTDDPKRYICHPVVIDAMFQAMMICLNPESKKLHVPISIGRFIWFGKITGENCYAYGKVADNKEYTGVLMNDNGTLVAVMVGADFMETTVGNIMSLIEAQRQPYPSMYEDVWREQLGPFERRQKINTDTENNTQTEEYENHSTVMRRVEANQTYNKLTESDVQFFGKFEKLNGFYMLKALDDLGLKLNVGDFVETDSITKDFNILSNLKRFFCYILTELCVDGYLELVHEDSTDASNMKFKLIRALPPREEICSGIFELYTELHSINPVDAKGVAATGENLAEILTGRQSGLAILFPEDTSNPGPAESFYYGSKMSAVCKNLADDIYPPIIKEIQNGRESGKTVFRILESGAGTGSFTKTTLEHLIADGPSYYEYTYTDISPAFFSKGEKIFENIKMRVNYKVLNIEEDPTSQGFIPHHYDMIIASYVVHTTKSIENALANLRNLLRPGGTLIMTELVKPYRVINLIFGVLDGFWRFEDTHLRQHNCELSAAKYQNVLEKLEYDDFTCVHFFNSHAAIISARAAPAFSTYYSKHLKAEKKSWIVFAEDGQISKFIRNKLNEVGKRVIVAKRSIDTVGISNVSNDTQDTVFVKHNNPSDVLKVYNSVGNEQNLEGIVYLWGLDYTSSENNYAEICQPFLSLCKILASKDIPVKLIVLTKGNICIDDNKMQPPTANPLLAMARVLQNENPSLIVKTVDLDPTPSMEKTAEEGIVELFTTDGEVTVAYRKNKRIVPRLVPLKVSNTALKFPKSDYFHLKLPSSCAIPDLRFVPMELPPLKENHVEVQVKAFGLNFRDVFAVMKPDPYFEKVNTVGIDYSGVITAVGSEVTKFKVGDSVIGCTMYGGAMPSHVQVFEEYVIELPKEITPWEGATLPAVAATAYVCLIKLAKIQEGDTVLIHTASGGVGCCAIQLCQNKKCTIVATAGSNRKREYLKNLGIKHIFNSRNTDYGTQIREALGGKGVDVVLNSLTGEGFKEASLSVCNENARFIEMSKLNVWSVEEVKKLRPDIQYELVDLSESSEETMREYTDQVKEFVQKSTLKPIPYVRFDASEIREALTYLQKAKHIGKIVCVMPENLKGSSQDAEIPLFNDRSSYMITGGLGGIGLEVAKWMANSGAKHILLVGRNPPKEKVAEEIQKLLSKKINVRVIQCDVGDREQCIKMLNEIKAEDSGLPPLRGIMHAAGVLSDDLYYSQTWENFEITFNPKVRGGWNLHELTLDYPLEHFVMFSSATANVCSVAQSNHCGANYFLDSLAHYRNSIGLPAMTINWGQWGQVGVAADIEVAGIRPFTVLQGICALEKAMQSHKLQCSVIEAEFQILRKGLTSAKKYLEELKTSKGSSQLGIGIDADKFWKEYDATETRAEKYEVVRKTIAQLIRMTLKMEPDEPIDDHANFQDMGMDSLMMIEMKNGLQASVGKRVKTTVNSVRDCKTVHQLSTRLVELISGVEELPPPTKDELIELIKEDSILPDDIKPEVTIATIKPSEIRTVLITGVTGNFGPYVLREICRRPEIEKIYCVVRDNRLFSPKERLKQILAEKKLLPEINMEKIECLAGDVTKPLLGLNQDIYDNLAEKVDAIFHLAVKAMLEEIYCKSEHVNHSRTINVMGTKQILKLASEKKTKHVFHASTTISTSKSDENGCFSEDWPVEGDFDNKPNSAYHLSKFIQDRLMAQAVEQGIPCKVFRFPFMGGDSQLGGNVSILDNHLMMRMMGYMYLGCMPARNVPIMIVPVDIAADLSVKIFFNDDTPCEMYNVSNPYVEDELLLEEVAKEFGYEVKVVEQEEFLQKVNKLEGEERNDILDVVKLVKSRQDSMEDVEENVPEVVTNWLAGRKDVFLSKKLNKLVDSYPNCMEPAWVILKKDLQHAKDSGIFAKIGLK